MKLKLRMYEALAFVLIIGTLMATATENRLAFFFLLVLMVVAAIRAQQEHHRHKTLVNNSSSQGR